MSTGIQWTDETWNPTTGCTRVSDGCAHCYAFQVHDQRHVAWKRGRWDAAPEQYHKPFSQVQLLPDRLTLPLHWHKPRKVFVDSMSDLFHEAVPDEYIDQVLAVMALTPQHTYQVLTKRPERMRAYVSAKGSHAAPGAAADNATRLRIWRVMKSMRPEVDPPPRHWYHAPAVLNWPLANVWLGTSVEDQAAADTRIPELLATPAAVRFLSCEPLLGPLDLTPWMPGQHQVDKIDAAYWAFSRQARAKPPSMVVPEAYAIQDGRGISWVIVGGESGAHARVFQEGWARSIRDQCAAAGAAFFMKQYGSNPHTSRVNDGRTADGVWPIKLNSRHGGDIEEFPKDLRIREFPGAPSFGPATNSWR